MSGIAAVFRADGGDVEPGIIDRIIAAIAYRGTDGANHLVEGPVAIGHLALHTSAEARSASQPLTSACGNVTVAMDGYIANYEDLRKGLLERGARLRSSADAELVVHAYLLWGEDFVRHIEGEFAVCIFDRSQQAFLCARDHMGLRPLHFHWDGASLTIASDIAGVLAGLSRQPELNLDRLAEAAGNVWLSRDQTIWQGIYRLLPAHTLVIRNGSMHLSRYWDLPAKVDIRYPRAEDYVEHYREMLTRCVRNSARTDTPLAVEVSGGLDSSAVAALASELARENKLPAPSLAGYTYSAERNSPAYELDYVRELAEFIGLKVSEVPLYLPEIDWYRRQAAEDRDLATFPNMAMQILLGQKMAADGSRVVLTGQGGDIWLNGSNYYYFEALRDLDLRNLAGALKADIATCGLRRTAAIFARGGIAPLLPTRLKQALGSNRRTEPDDLDSLFWLAEPLRKKLVARRDTDRRYWRDQYHTKFKQKKLLVPIYLRLWDVVSRQNARWNYEERNPMLSRSFVEFSARTPEFTRTRGRRMRIVHRMMLEDIAPKSIARRRTKAEFSQIFDHLRDPIGEFFNHCLENKENYSLANFLDDNGARKLQQKFCNAAIDAGMTWEVWGTCSACMAIMNATESMDGVNRNERHPD